MKGKAEVDANAEKAQGMFYHAWPKFNADRIIVRVLFTALSGRREMPMPMWHVRFWPHRLHFLLWR
jgi:hypothetical protein